MSNQEIFNIPKNGLTLVHYDESGEYKFKTGEWGQVVMTFDTPKESGSVSMAGFEARSRIKKLILNRWVVKG